MNEAFKDIFLLNDVILVSNEASFGDNGVMRATVIGYNAFGDSKSPIPQFRDKKTGREFYFNGALFAEDSKFYDYLMSYSDVKERWNFVISLNYKNDFRYTMNKMDDVKELTHLKIRRPKKTFWQWIGIDKVK